MAADGAGRHRIRIDQVCIGLHIKLDSWMGHPFLFSSFKIKNAEQIATLKAMGLTEIEYLPEKSDTKPAPPPPAVEEAPPAPDPVAEMELDELMREKKERIETLSREREQIRAAERKYVKTASSVKNVMRLANNNPRHAAQLSGEIADELADIFLAEQNPYIHLMGDNVSDENAFFHSINVTVLAMILARALDVDPETMRDVAQGAILHDVGKALVPSQILLKDEDLTAAEDKLLQMHPGYGIKLMQPVAELPSRVREIILFHHEMADGSGYPKGVKADTLDRAVRIVAIANAYDNLCNQRVVKRSRTPSEALSHMYKNELAKYDKAALSAFVKALGIYPPGTIVKLRSGRVGIVMSVDSADLLHPDLMIYDPAIPKDAAAVVNLRRDLEDAVERTLRPSALPEAVHDYLSPRKRICYFVDHAGSS
jgi:putative nucleotidyltransferase with HDIG domain